MNSLLTDLKTYFKVQDDVCIAIAYGSVTGQNFNASSDIDLAVLLTQPLSVDRKYELLTEISLIVKRPTDLVDLRTAHVPLSREILTRGIYLKMTQVSLKEELQRRMIYEVNDFLPLRKKVQMQQLKRFIKS